MRLQNLLLMVVGIICASCAGNVSPKPAFPERIPSYSLEELFSGRIAFMGSQSEWEKTTEWMKKANERAPSEVMMQKDVDRELTFKFVGRLDRTYHVKPAEVRAVDPRYGMNFLEVARVVLFGVYDCRLDHFGFDTAGERSDWARIKNRPVSVFLGKTRARISEIIYEMADPEYGRGFFGGVEEVLDSYLNTHDGYWPSFGSGLQSSAAMPTKIEKLLYAISAQVPPEELERYTFEEAYYAYLGHIACRASKLLKLQFQEATPPYREVSPPRRARRR